MLKIYTQNNPQIVMEGARYQGYISGSLEAYFDDGKISVKSILQNNEKLIIQEPHTSFTDENGGIFGNLQETIDALNDIFNTETNNIISDVTGIMGATRIVNDIAITVDGMNLLIANGQTDINTRYTII